MKIFEYQAKELFRESGIPVPRGEVVRTAQEAENAYATLGSGTVVVKAQVLVGGRGKAGGVQLVHSASEVTATASRLLGKSLTTHQGSEPVEALLIEEAVPIEKELYVALLIDRDRAASVLLASGRGGVDIEDLAKTEPEAIAKIAFDSGSPLPDTSGVW